MLESTKSAVDVYAPVGGEIVEVNESLADHPEKINTAAETEGWLFRLRLVDVKEVDRLYDEPSYRDLLNRG